MKRALAGLALSSALWSGALWAAGCSCEGPRTATQVIVTIDGDETVRALSTDLRVEVFGGAARPAPPQFPEEPKDDVSFDVSASSGWPRTLALAPENRDATRVYRVVATARDGSGATIAVGRVISGYVMGEVRTVRVFLSAACDPLECEPSETCDPIREMCVPAEIPPEELPAFDGGIDDGGIGDGGNRDGGESDSGEMDAGGLDTGTPFDAGADAGTGDTGIDGGAPGDAGMDAGVDAGRDAGMDAGRDAGMDAGRDAGMDAVRDAGPDARDGSTGPDGGLDVPGSPPDTGIDPAAALRFNEVDSVGPGDFAELFNAGAVNVTLDGLSVDVVDVGSCTVMMSIPLSGNSAPGGVSAVATGPIPDATLGLVLHRGTAILAVAAFSNPILVNDCPVAGTTVTFATERLVDPGTIGSIQRCPDGSGAWGVRTPATYFSLNSCL